MQCIMRNPPAPPPERRNPIYPHKLIIAAWPKPHPAAATPQNCDGASPVPAASAAFSEILPLGMARWQGGAAATAVSDRLPWGGGGPGNTTSDSTGFLSRVGDSVEHDIPATTNAWPASCPRPRSQTLYDNVCRMGPDINKRKAQDREAVCRTDYDSLLLLASELEISPFF